MKSTGKSTAAKPSAPDPQRAKKGGGRSEMGGPRRVFDAVAQRTAQAAGSPFGFGLAAVVIVVWAATGPVFGFSDTWQLVINTGTTIVTFLMVFLLQHTQNKDTRALQIKLDELIAAASGASNRLISAENLTEEELEALQRRFEELKRKSARTGRRAQTSIEEESD